MSTPNIEALSAPLPEDILSLAMAGHFSLAEEVIGLRLKKGLPSLLRARLEIELIIMGSIKRQYIYAFPEALEIMQKLISGFEGKELEQLWKEGIADWRFIDGEMRFSERFQENILKRPEYAARAGIKGDAGRDWAKEAIDQMKTEGECAVAIKIRHSVRIKEPRANSPALVHIPIPIEGGMAEKFKVLSYGPSAPYLSDKSHPSRTACFRLTGASEAFIEYEYISRARHIALDPRKASPEQPSFETGEILPQAPFTPYLRETAKAIVGSEANPLEKARKIYNFITQNIEYSLMRDYIGLVGIAEYCLSGMKGDCGVQALLFIALCRASGVPARWQSGWYASPNDYGRHDWAQFFVEPFGWLCCDLSFGGKAFRSGDMERWGFYFGNMDPFRMAANNAFQHPFDPPKNYLRADPYDSQSGEAEYIDGPVGAGGLEWGFAAKCEPLWPNGNE